MIIISLTNNYYVEGEVIEVRDAKNGVFLIQDEAGDTILIRLPKNAEEVSYANWTTGKVVLGDIISVYGKPKRYTSSTSDADVCVVESGLLTVTKHEHVFADATCTVPATCACLVTSGDALGHTDEKDTNGYCDRCEWNLAHDITSIKTHYNDIKDTENYDSTNGVGTWSNDEFSVSVAKSTGTFSTSATTHVRWQNNNELTVSSLNGKKIVSIVFVVNNTSYVDEMEAILTKAGYEYTITNEVEVTITVDSLESLTIKNTASKTTRISDVKIIFEK